MEEMGLSNPAIRLRDLTKNKEQYRRNEDDEFKLWPTNRDRDGYREVMSAALPVDYSQLAHKDQRIVQAHKYFSESARDYLQVDDATLQVRRADSLETALTQLLKVVVIDLDADEDAQEIFETLNSRGVKLSSADLIKNLIFQRLEDEAANTEQAYERYWKNFETAFWEKEIVAGRLKQPRTAVFFNHFLIARTGDVVTASEVFYRFKEYLAESAKPTLQILKEIHDIAVVYEKHVANADNDNIDLDAVDLFVYRTQVMDIEVVKSVLIVLLDPSLEVIEDQVVIEALTHLESWLVRRAIMRAVTKGSNRFIAQLVANLREAPRSKAADTVREFLASQTADSSYWPDDLQIEDQLHDFRLYRLMPRGRTRMLLEAIEDELRGITRLSKGEAEQRCPRLSLTIEHLVPQKWSTNWPLTPEESEEGRNRVVQTLGNLTLLTKKLNSKISNGPWIGEEGKLVALRGHSALLLNARIDSEFNDEWSAAKIPSRTSAMTQLIKQIWPVPLGHRVSLVGEDQPTDTHVSVVDLISAGMIDDGTVLRPAATSFSHRSAMIRNDGSIEVDSGEVFASLSGAARNVTAYSTSGWHFWCVETTGTSMYDLREEFRARFNLTLAEDDEEFEGTESDGALV